jgi:peptidoglycan/LPS O-acetylase OafA/YrhL
MIAAVAALAALLLRLIDRPGRRLLGDASWTR